MNDHLSIALAALLACLAPIASAPALDLKRPEVRAFIEETSRDHGFARDQLESLLKQAETKQAILDAISRPAERVVPWYEYRERFLTEKRILQGTDFWIEHSESLRRIPDPNVAASVVGILGVETSFGRITGRFRVIDALATLAFDYPPRSDFFRSELQQFLLLSREEAVDPRTALGSYAGAMGAPQFISSSYRNYAIDGDGNGKRDLWNSWDDLSRFNIAKLELNETVQSLRDKGVRFETSLPADAPALLIVAQGKDGPVYRVGFTNFYVVTRYNRSPMYAMAVHDLGQAVVNFMRDATR
jgi:membrane-bound lytic murein transglycosylase B